MLRRKESNFIGFLGFTGLLRFQYFTKHDPSYISYFAFFSFFAYFWINQISKEMLDERYVENSKVAKAFTFDIAIYEFAIPCYTTFITKVTREILLIMVFLCFSSLQIIYAIKFYQLEKM